MGQSKLNADAHTELVRIKENPGFSEGRVSKTRIFRLNADNLIADDNSEDDDNDEITSTILMIWLTEGVRIK